MRTITKEYNIYKFQDSNTPKEVKERIREYFHLDFDLYEHSMIERIKTLKKVAEILGGDLDYSISCVPDRGEFIKISPKYDQLDFESFWDVINKELDCPFTGVCYDHDIIDHFTRYNLNIDTLNTALNDYLKSIHDEYESMLTDEYLNDLCEANEYEFYENGKLY